MFQFYVGFVRKKVLVHKHIHMRAPYLRSAGWCVCARVAALVTFIAGPAAVVMPGSWVAEVRNSCSACS